VTHHFWRVCGRSSQAEILLDLICFLPDIWFSSPVMADALLRWSFGILVGRLSIGILQQALLRQAMPGSNEGGVRTVVCLRLVLVFVVRDASEQLPSHGGLPAL
jgi:hypothetical protein